MQPSERRRGTRPTSSSSAARACSPIAIPARRPCSSSGRSPSSRARPRSSRRSGGRTSTSGLHELAAERFAAIVEADPLAHYAHFGLGLSRAPASAIRAAARRHLRMAVLLKPDDETYQRALERLGDAA